MRVRDALLSRRGVRSEFALLVRMLDDGDHLAPAPPPPPEPPKLSPLPRPKPPPPPCPSCGTGGGRHIDDCELA